LAFKRLRKGKTIESEKAFEISLIARKKTEEAVKFQNLSLMKLSEESEETAEEIRSSGYYLLRASSDINDYLGAVAGKYSLSPVKIELSDFLAVFCEKAEPFLIKKGFAVLRNIPVKNVFIEADAEKLLGVLANLVRNSMENSSAGSRIRLSLSVTKKFAKITVGDKGFGMDKETAEHCFEPFFGKTVGRKNKMGLGLTLARHFAEESGGRMNIRTEKGKGTAVSLLLPLMEESTKVAVEASVSEIFGERNHLLEIAFADIETQ